MNVFSIKGTARLEWKQYLEETAAWGWNTGGWIRLSPEPVTFLFRRMKAITYDAEFLRRSTQYNLHWLLHYAQAP